MNWLIKTEYLGKNLISKNNKYDTATRTDKLYFLTVTRNTYNNKVNGYVLCKLQRNKENETYQISRYMTKFKCTKIMTAIERADKYLKKLEMQW